MELNIDVSMPVKSARNADNYEDIIVHGYSFADAYIETLESKVVISGLPSPNAGTHAKIHLEYFEEYKPETSFGEFFSRAEEYAKNYCKRFMVGAE